ncbi:hypothetical protein C8R47DRAFT_403522 [Mycena vitilis]|nr:hypothetical protein C8R47DRAFT_403522 [Mycena vitilis]
MHGWPFLPTPWPCRLILPLAPPAASYPRLAAPCFLKHVGTLHLQYVVALRRSLGLSDRSVSRLVPPSPPPHSSLVPGCGYICGVWQAVDVIHKCSDLLCSQFGGLVCRF